jgi:hypothetical protein
MGFLEIDLFPSSTPLEIKKALREFSFDGKSVSQIRNEIRAIDSEWRMSLEPLLRDESVSNFEWRNSMCHAITRHPNESSSEEQEIVSGIAPEFYRQIEWLPGARFDRGELVFDELWEEADLPGVKGVYCDTRVKALILNIRKLFSDIDFVNVGRISHSLSRRPTEGERRGNVYIIQYRQSMSKKVSVLLVRFQKWGVAQRLDEGKDLAQAIVETDEYTDYILDRRLMCLQLGMNLPARIGNGRVLERYSSSNRYDGMTLHNPYFVRPYVEGVASDKVPIHKFKNPFFAIRFAELMGDAAALDLVVGRLSTLTGELLFDNNYEIFKFDAAGMPSELVITDHAGSFNDYKGSLMDGAKRYAHVMRRRRDFVSDYQMFVSRFLKSFETRLSQVQSSYRSRRQAFDSLFADRPYDSNGSGAYRWACVLSRIDKMNAADIAESLKNAIYAED